MSIEGIIKPSRSGLLALAMSAAAIIAQAEAVLPAQSALLRPIAQSGEGFGHPLLIAGGDALAAAPYRDLVVDGLVSADAGAVDVFSVAAGGWQYQQTLSAPTPQSGRRFGIQVAISDDRVAIASLYRFDLFERSGAGQPLVHVFGNEFAPLSGIRPLASVALRGDRLAYGYGSSTGAGRIHLYQRLGGVWQAQGLVLYAESPQGGDYFGYSLAFDGDRLLVGAPNQNLPGNPGAGSVEVYQIGTGALHVQRIESFVVRAHADFGQALAVNGNRLLVGAPGEDITVAGNRAGAAYLYLRSGAGNWQFEQRFVAPDYQPEAYLGRAVAVHGDLVVIGAPGHDVQLGPFQFQDAGRAYVHRQQGGNWTLRQMLNLGLADLDSGDEYASAVALGADWLLVAAPREHTDAVAQAGLALVHVRPVFRDGFEPDFQ